MRWIALALVLLPVAAQAQEDPKPDYYGVWKGAIGVYPVMACIDQDGLGKARGAYYYLSSLAPIGLAGAETGTAWDETDNYEENGAHWRGVSVKGDTLSATWAKGAKMLPINLARQQWKASDDYDGPCMGDAFLAPRAVGGRTISADANFEGWAYRKVTYLAGKQFGDSVSIESLSFAPAQPGDKAINAALAKDMPDGTYRSDFMQCLGFEVASSGSDGDYGFLAEPDTVTGRWLNLTLHYDTSCGGAHPNSWYSFRTFDRESGAEVQLYRWLNDKAAEHADGDQPGQDYYTLLPALREVVLAHAPKDADEDDAECADAARDEDFWYLGLGSKGMEFVPNLPHVAAACTNTYEVPWVALAPWLSAEGKAGAATFR